jgi:Zn finger protein HypA/HybF involved in hydrogenase expression
MLSVYQRIVASSPQMQRGQVWCLTCGKTESVNTARALQYGWPQCCGHLMSIDSPDERAAETARERTAL